MAIDYQDTQATFKEVVSIQEVDALMEWLLAHPDATIDLQDCQHLHLAALQALTFAKRPITAWPTEETLTLWIKSLLTQPQG